DELPPELIVGALRRVPDNRQSTAPLGGRGSECRHHNVPAPLQGAANGQNVSLSSCFIGEKVKHGSIMPEVEALLGEVNLSDVPNDPGHLAGSRAEPRLRLDDCALGEI